MLFDLILESKEILLYYFFFFLIRHTNTGVPKLFRPSDGHLGHEMFDPLMPPPPTHHRAYKRNKKNNKVHLQFLGIYHPSPIGGGRY